MRGTANVQAPAGLFRSVELTVEPYDGKKGTFDAD